MSSQEQLQFTEEAVIMHGLWGVHSEVALLLWANRHGQLLHPLVEARLNEIRSSQMTEVDDSIMYHAQSFTEEPEKENTSDFSDADAEELFYAQSQEQPRPEASASPDACVQSQIVNHQPTGAQTPPAFRYAHVRTSTPEPPTGLEDQQEPSSTPAQSPPAPSARLLEITTSNVRLEPPTLQPTGSEDKQEPSVLQGSNNTIILPDDKPLMTDSEFDNLFFASVSVEQDKTSMDDILGPTLNQPATSFAAIRQEGVPGSSGIDCVCDAAVTAGILEWD